MLKSLEKVCCSSHAKKMGQLFYFGKFSVIPKKNAVSVINADHVTLDLVQVGNPHSACWHRNTLGARLVLITFDNSVLL